MKDKSDNKTLGLSSAKSNAERQKKFRDSMSESVEYVRLNCYISHKADKQLKKLMASHGFNKKLAVSFVLEQLADLEDAD